MSWFFYFCFDNRSLIRIISDAPNIIQLRKELAAKEAKKNEELPTVEEDLKRLQQEVYRIQAEFAKAQTTRNTLAKSHESEIDKIKSQMEEEVCIPFSLQLHHC